MTEIDAKHRAALALVEAAHDLFAVKFCYWDAMTPADKERLGNVTGCIDEELDRIAARWADYCHAIGRPELLRPGHISTVSDAAGITLVGSYTSTAYGEVSIDPQETASYTTAAVIAIVLGAGAVCWLIVIEIIRAFVS